MVVFPKSDRTGRYLRQESYFSSQLVIGNNAMRARVIKWSRTRWPAAALRAITFLALCKPPTSAPRSL